MAVRIYLEIGHEASLRNKKTQEGFTHDWEVFVRGCDGAEIHYYVEKVVFYLHDTFPKPKRVVKEPPYSVKESGYAGFNLPIDVYLRNNSEPKKIRFNYDLHLQNSGPAILKVQKEKYVFNSLTDDFKMKLLKGGGSVGSSGGGGQDASDSRSSSLDDKNQMTNKPKLSGCSSDIIKKPKIKADEPYRNFQELFGSPILTSSTKAPQELKQTTSWKDSKSTSKVDKGLTDKVKPKHSPHKEKEGHKDREKSKEKSSDSSEKKSKEEKKSKDKSKERSKDKSTKPPRPKSPSPSPKPRPVSPPAPRPPSPNPVKHKEAKHEKRDQERKSKKEKRSKEHKYDEQKSEEKKQRDVVKAPSPPPPLPPPSSKAPAPEKKEKQKSSKEPQKEEREKHSSKSKKKDKERREKKEEKREKSEKKSESKQQQISFKSDPPLPPVVKREKPYVPPPDLIDDSSSSSSSSSSIVKSKERPLKEEKSNKFKKDKGENAIKCKRKSEVPPEDEPPSKKRDVCETSDTEQDSPGKPVGPDMSFSKVYAYLLMLLVQHGDDYLDVLRELQHKIMGLKDNEDLQRVVQLIAETGQYEISAHTFDFDLCLLDRATVQQLQEFFTT